MTSSLIAVDIGNTSLRAKCFETGEERRGPPQMISAPPDLVLPRGAWREAVDWRPRGPAAPCTWVVASVQRDATEWLRNAIRHDRPQDTVYVLTHRDIPLTIALEHPERAGTDRLAAAVAANGRRHPDRSAVIVDSGTAITVDLVDRRGVFQGGAILPGVAMSARALHAFTDLLPLADPPAGPVAPVGRTTEAAIRSGLFWGAVGAVGTLIQQVGQHQGAEPQVFLTGGATLWSPWLPPEACVVEDLVLEGVAMSIDANRHREAPSSDSRHKIL